MNGVLGQECNEQLRALNRVANPLNAQSKFQSLLVVFYLCASKRSGHLADEILVLAAVRQKAFIERSTEERCTLSDGRHLLASFGKRN